MKQPQLLPRSHGIDSRLASFERRSRAIRSYWFFAIFAIAPAFDYKSINDGGDIAQMVMVIVSALAGSILIIDGFQIQGKTSTYSRILLLTALLFGVFSVISVAVNHVVFARYIRVAAPYALLTFSFSATKRFLDNTRNLDALFKIILVTSLINAIWRFSYVILYMHVPLSDMRYQVLSPGTIMLCVWSVSHILIRRRITPWTLILALAGWAPTALSVTRGLLGSLAFGISIVFVSAWQRAIRQRSSVALLRLQMGACIGLVAAGIFLAALWKTAPELIYRWTARSSGLVAGEVSDDATYLTRRAEIDGLLGKIDSPTKIAIGNGLGSTYIWDQAYNEALKGRVGDEALELDYWYAGHNIWVYIFYASGISGLFWLATVLVLPFRLCFRIARTLVASLPEAPSSHVLTVIGVFAVYSVYSMVGGPFSERFGGILLGITLGVICWVDDDMRHGQGHVLRS